MPQGSGHVPFIFAFLVSDTGVSQSLGEKAGEEGGLKSGQTGKAGKDREAGSECEQLPRDNDHLKPVAPDMVHSPLPVLL